MSKRSSRGSIVDSREAFGEEYDDFFVFALPREPRTIIYTEKDKSNSFFKFKEIKQRYRSVAAIFNSEAIRKRAPVTRSRTCREPCTRYIRSFLVIIVVFVDAISDKFIRRRRIDAIYESGIQPDLRIFQDVLFSLKDFSFNSEQKRVPGETFQMKFSKVSNTYGYYILY